MGSGFGNDSDSGYLKSVLDALPDQIAVINDSSIIEWVNGAWNRFYLENGGAPDTTWSGLSYLACCEHASLSEESDISPLVHGVRSVLNKSSNRFDFAYPCDSPTERRWFMMSVVPMALEGSPRFVVTHRNITQEKLAQERLKKLAVTDALTGINNRRYFNEQLDLEWRRGERNRHELSLIFFDIDFFKQINDTFGHVAGDQCLTAISAAVKHYARRPGDVAARIGGDELALLLANTSRCAAQTIAQRIQSEVAELKINSPRGYSSAAVTLSIGIASMLPQRGTGQRDLLVAADNALYDAKHNGRNRISIASEVLPLNPSESGPKLHVSYLS